MLIADRHDDSVRSHCLAGANCDHIVQLEPVDRNLDLSAITVQPDIPQVSPNGVKEVAFRPFNLRSAKAYTSAQNGFWKNRHYPNTSDDYNHVQPFPSKKTIFAYLKAEIDTPSIERTRCPKEL
jgi:hypothetical protein